MLNSYGERSLALHKQKQGKLEITPTVPLDTKEDLSLAYTPGVATPCEVIAKNPDEAFNLTIKGRTIAVVTDGSSVLGLGNIGAVAGLPVMEGKAILYKKFAGLDAFPICLSTQDTEEIIKTIKHISPTFGAIHLEDIAAPRCFEVEERLAKELNLPVMHDDQHGTAVVALAGFLNALKVVGKQMADVRVVISGSGSAGIASANLLLEAGVKHLNVLDSKGMIAVGRADMNTYKTRLAQKINPTNQTGTLEEIIKGADVFIGVSKPGVLTSTMVKTMNHNAIIFALANPIPEITPDEAKTGGASVIATGRSDYPNQVNNVLAYPGLFLGAMEARRSFVPAMYVAAATALANLVQNPTADHILPSILEGNIARVVAEAVKKV